LCVLFKQFSVAAKDDKELMPPPSAPMRSGSGSGTDEPAKPNEGSSPGGDSKSTDPKGKLGF